MTTELRHFGDGNTVVLYTESNEVYQKLQDSAKCFKQVFYEQEDGNKLRMVGVYLYSNGKFKPWLMRTLDLKKWGIFSLGYFYQMEI